MADNTGSAYSAAVVDHFDRPRNVGRFDAADDVITATAGTREQGAIFTLSAKIKNGRVQSLRFQAYGCPHCIAAGSWFSERVVGATQQDLRGWSWREAAGALAVPAEKRGRLLILEDAVHALAEAVE